MNEQSEFFQQISVHRDQFRSLMLEGIREGLSQVYRVKLAGHYIGSYFRWPSLYFNKNGFPNISLSSFNSPIRYRDAFGRLAAEPLIDEKDCPSFSRFESFIKQTDLLAQRFLHPNWDRSDTDAPIDFIAVYAKSLLTDAIERYGHLHGIENFNEARANAIIDEFEAFIFDDNLSIDIFVPILFTHFDFDIQDFGEGVSVQEISKELHLARGPVRSPNVAVHDHVMDSATHALFFENWQVPNPIRIWDFDILSNPRAYPIEEIDRFFGAIRIETGINTGYAQILSLAKGWIRHVMADLPPVEGATLRAYPAVFEDYYWNRKEFPRISPETCGQVRSYFQGLQTATERALDLGLKRLNQCLVRDSEEDAVLDATIALETLLGDSGGQEMTHKLAMRVAGLMKTRKDEKSPHDAFTDIKRIYRFRSAIVHGSKDIDRRRVVKLDDQTEIPARILAVDYLRKVLQILIEKPELRNAQSIDEILLLSK